MPCDIGRVRVSSLAATLLVYRVWIFLSGSWSSILLTTVLAFAIHPFF